MVDQSSQRKPTELNRDYVERDVEITQLLERVAHAVNSYEGGNILLVASSDSEAERIEKDIEFHRLSGVYVVPAERIDRVRGSVFHDVIVTHPELIDRKTLHYVEHESKYLAPRRIWPDMEIPLPKHI